MSSIPTHSPTQLIILAATTLPAEPAATGWRGQLISLCRRGLTYIQRTAPHAAAMNQGWRHHLADTLYWLIAWLAGGQAFRAWQTHRHHLTKQVLETTRRDPGRRILVVVNLRRCHHIRPTLKKHPEIQVVPYSEL